MNLLAVASLIFSLCHAHHKGHRRGTHSQNKTTEGPPPKCSKSSCEKIFTIGLDPWDPPKRWCLEIDCRLVSSWREWWASPSNSNKLLWDPTKNCTSEPVDSIGNGKPGLSKSNEIVHVFRVEMSHVCIPTEKECDTIRGRRGRGYDGKCFYNSKNLITINQNGRVIDYNFLGDMDAYDDISCLSC